MRILPSFIALLAASLLPACLAAAAEPAPARARPLTGSDWERAARLQAQKEALSAESAAAIERSRASDPDVGPTDSVEVIGIDDGKPKRGESQRRDGGPVTWIDGNCFYASPPSMFEPGAAVRLWLPTCKPGSPRVLTLGRAARMPAPPVDSVAEPTTLVRPVAARPSAPAEPEVSRANAADPR